MLDQRKGGYDPEIHGEIEESEAHEAAEIEKRQMWEKLQAAVSGFIAKLEEEASDRVRRRNAQEKLWVQWIRQYWGRYDPVTEATLNADPDRSRVFINYTRAKTTAWAARLGDLLFPNDDRNWGLDPTPVPELTDQARQKLKEADEARRKAEAAAAEHNAMVDAGAAPDALAAKRAEAEQHASALASAMAFDKEVRDLTAEADRRAKAMQREIDDQLTESRYPAVCRDVIDDACKLGVGILKGPLTSTKPRRRWEKIAAAQGTEGAANAYVLTIDSDPRPMYRRVNPWHFFPDPDAVDISDSDSTFERHLLSASKFKRWARMLGWHPETVRDVLQDGPIHTTSGDFQWLTELRLLEPSNENAFINRYVVWEYHGPMEAEDIITMLRRLGRDDDAEVFAEACEDDPLTEHMVICYFTQGWLLKLEEYFPLDSGETLYSVFPFEKSESSILGAIGVPGLMTHEQSMLNSAVRMMLDNGALSVGPQVVIDKTQVEPENGSWKLAPRKVWKKKGQELARDQAPFATYNIPMNQAQLQGIIELALRFIDDVISMPMIAQGEQGAHITQTSSGMSMLFNSANVIFRRVVKNWDDDLTTPSIRRAFDWNMQFNPKDEIKGDMQAVARGTSVLLVREVQSHQLMLIAQNWSAHPVLGPAIRVYEVMRLTLQAMNINPDSILCTPEEFEQRMKAAAEAQAGQESPEAIRAKAALDVANINAESRKAEAETQREIAKLNQQTEVLKLIQKDGVDMAQIQAMLAGKKLDTDSRERLFAAEAAIEQRNAAEARAAGQEPSGSGGYISEGGGVE